MHRHTGTFSAIATLALLGCGGGSSSSDMASDVAPDASSQDTVVFTMTSDGALGGRSGADAACATAQSAHPALAGLTVRALVCIEGPLEVSSFPSLFGLPAARRVVSLSGTELGASWADFLDGPTVSLASAGVLGGASQFFTGCATQDGLGACLFDCNGFASNDMAYSACVGRGDYTDATWIAWGNILACDAPTPVLCVAYAP